MENATKRDKIKYAEEQAVNLKIVCGVDRNVPRWFSHIYDMKEKKKIERIQIV